VKLQFGPVSIVLGTLTIVSAKRTGTAGSRMTIPVDAVGPLFIISLCGGVITGSIPIGEGELVAALLMLLFGIKVATCIGLGVVLLSINSIFLTLIHQFILGGIPWKVGPFTGLESEFGARLAP
jgi:uncharacterized membrane protein YfcA